MYLQERTGRGVRIAVVDSGVHAAHPHVRGVAGGVAIADDGTLSGDYADRLGHGTAVVAAIREKAPEAEIFAVKVFWRSLATDVRTLEQAFEVAVSHGARVINVSLGTSDPRHRERLGAAVARATAGGAIVVAADEDRGVRFLPGALDGVVPVRAHWTADRGAYSLAEIDGRAVLLASAYPRDIPGISRDRNLNGVSFAVANASAFVARAVEIGSSLNPAAIFAILGAHTCVQA
ncbi:MAG TPA: S8 family serine peptidase [Vicinamibacterales bacterium]|nr:S8 family serine peptidase [Vicinamibacterales bacterium]